MDDPTISNSEFPQISVSRKAVRLRGFLRATVAVCICLPSAVFAQSLPQNGTVASGNVSIGQSGQNMTVTQGSDQAVVNWNSFSIGSNASVNFVQPSSNSAILNRVTGNTTSDIHGSLTANGNVYLVNPNGIFIGPNGTVKSQGFVASTLGISDEDFNNRRLRFRGDGASASVVNQGRVTIGRGGYAALLGGHVRNDGVVTVPLGRVAFGSGERMTLDLSGDQFLQVALPTGEDGEVLIDNAGAVRAEGGLIEMRAATARNAVRNAINLSGVAEARSVSVRNNGTIVLGGGAGGGVNVSGAVSTRSTVDSSAKTKGGDITITGNEIALEGARIDASGNGGGGLIRVGGNFAGAGNLQHADFLFADAETRIVSNALRKGDGGPIAIWSDRETDFAGDLSSRGGVNGGDGGFVEISSIHSLKFSGFADRRAPKGEAGILLLDPDNIVIDPGAGGETMLETNLAGGSVYLDTFNPSGGDVGDITINADIDWSTPYTLGLSADNDIYLNGAINGLSGRFNIDATGMITASNAASINVDHFSIFSGNWTEVGANLTPINVNSYFMDYYSATVVRATSGAGTVNNPYMISDIYGLQGVSSGTSSSDHFALANDIDASGTSDWNNFYGEGFLPIDYVYGSLDGNGHTVDGLYIYQSGEGGPEAAAFIYSIGEDASVSDLNFTNADIEGSDSAILAVYNDGLIENVSVEGSLYSAGRAAGGLVAYNFGEITNSSADTSLYVDDEYDPYGDPRSFGGLVGLNEGNVTGSTATGDISLPGILDDMSVGGAVGAHLSGTLDDVVADVDISATGTLSGSAYLGGVAGSVGDPAGNYSGGDEQFDENTANVERAEGLALYNTRAYGDLTLNIQTDHSDPDGLYVGGQVGYLAGSSFLNQGRSYGDISVTSIGSTHVVAGGAIGMVGAQASVGQTRSMGGYLLTDIDGTGETGGFVGVNEGSITQSDTATDVRSYGAVDLITGGFAGVNEGSMTRTAANNEVFVDFSSGMKVIGGHTGRNDGGTIDMSYTIGDLIVSGSGSEYQSYLYNVGLFVGEQFGEIYESYAARSTSLADSAYLSTGFSGGFSDPADMEDVFFDSDLAGYTSSADGVVGYTTAQLQDTEFFLSTLAGVNGRFNLADWAPGASGFYPVLFNLVRAIYAEPDPVTVAEGETDSATTTGTVYGGAGSYAFDLSGDTLDTSTLFNDLVFSDTSVGAQTFTLAATSLDSANGETYRVVSREGDATIVAAPEQNPILPPPPIPDVVLPNPNDTITASSSLSGIVSGVSDQALQAVETLADAQETADALVLAAAACDDSSGDVTQYLACVSDALNDFADELDAIASDLPPGMQNVAQIVQNARVSIDQARSRAASRLATATTDAERDAIRRDALNESTAALATASNEIRKAISLVRVEDPELASIQRETIVAVSNAVDTVGIQLSRAVGL